jgi:hypothetical protein
LASRGGVSLPMLGGRIEKKNYGGKSEKIKKFKGKILIINIFFFSLEKTLSLDAPKVLCGSSTVSQS